jgi:hypothetical protein
MVNNSLDDKGCHCHEGVLLRISQNCRSQRASVIESGARLTTLVDQINFGAGGVGTVPENQHVCGN